MRLAQLIHLGRQRVRKIVGEAVAGERTCKWTLLRSWLETGPHRHHEATPTDPGEHLPSLILGHISRLRLRPGARHTLIKDGNQGRIGLGILRSE